jgi:hypothetical protein
MPPGGHPYRDTNLYVRVTCAEAFNVIMGELVQILLVLKSQADGLLCNKILLLYLAKNQGE